MHVDRPRHRPSLFLRSFSSWNLARSNAPDHPAHAASMPPPPVAPRAGARAALTTRHWLAALAGLTLACLLHRLLHALALLFIGLRLRLGIFHLRRCLLAIAATFARLRLRLRVVVTRLGWPCWPDGGWPNRVAAGPASAVPVVLLALRSLRLFLLPVLRWLLLIRAWPPRMACACVQHRPRRGWPLHRPCPDAAPVRGRRRRSLRRSCLRVPACWPVVPTGIAVDAFELSACGGEVALAVGLNPSARR